MTHLTQKIIVGLSGGVDSSVSALLLQQHGFNVEGLFMKNWEEDDQDECSVKQDLADAQAIADKLGIKLHTINFASEYWDDVFQDFIKQHKKGLTPNPDVLCNQRIKFNVFLEHALDLGADKIATGHYARIAKQNNRYQLKTGLDDNKDQSYFLHLLNQYQLSKSVFPLGELTKKQVRAIAKENDLITADKKDSTGICFIGERHFQHFLADYIPEKQGNMVTKDGTFIKHHPGVWFYTIGQRKGLGIGGRHDSNEPWFVADKNSANNELVVVQGEDEMLYHHCAVIEKIHWISAEKQALPLRCQAKIRYRQTHQSCVLEATQQGNYIAHFTDKQRAITPGQSIVFYDGDICLGGGIITNRQHHR